MVNRPERTRVYQNHHFDSTRWDGFEMREDDIVIATSYKAGTTWAQAIVAHLIFQDDDLPGSVGELSPWLDMRAPAVDVVHGIYDAQPHRRFIKTHLPFDGLPYDERVKYLYISRDARDVFVSLWNHYSRYTDEALQEVNQFPGRVGGELPPAPDDIHEFWHHWMTRGWFDWESDGWPYWSHLSNVQSWWNFRELPNIQLIHYADLLDDTKRETRRIAAFLEVEVPESKWQPILEAVSFESMKRQGERYAPSGGSKWKGGAETFFHKGTNGRWRDILSDEEIALYDAACRRSLTPECRRWLECGGSV